MSKPRPIDEHELLVVQSLKLALETNSVPLLSSYVHAVPSDDMDRHGIDVLLFLTSGMAVPIQIKAGKTTVGVVIPLASIDFNKMPERLTGRVSRRMISKASCHRKKHPDVKAMLFVAKPKNPSDEALQESLQNILKEIWEITEIMVKHTCHNYKMRNNPV